MTHDAQELLQKALTLPDGDRAELAGNLIASLDSVEDPDADAAWQAEVARRSEDVRSGRVNVVDWEAVRRRGRAIIDGK